MFLKFASLGSLIVATFLSVGMACGEPAPEKSPAERTDCYGDPLPPRVLARIGTVRLPQGDDGNCVAFSPDDKMVVSCGVDGTLRSWEVATGKEIHCFRGHQRLSCRSVSPRIARRWHRSAKIIPSGSGI